MFGSQDIDEYSSLALLYTPEMDKGMTPSRVVSSLDQTMNSCDTETLYPNTKIQRNSIYGVLHYDNHNSVGKVITASSMIPGLSLMNPAIATEKKRGGIDRVSEDMKH